MRKEDLYRVQKAISDKFVSCVFSDELGWPAWESFVKENGMEGEPGPLDFLMHEGGRVSVLDPSCYQRLWMAEEFALKIIFLGCVP